MFSLGPRSAAARCCPGQRHCQPPWQCPSYTFWRKYQTVTWMKSWLCAFESEHWWLRCCNLNASITIIMMISLSISESTWNHDFHYHDCCFVFLTSIMMYFGNNENNLRVNYLLLFWAVIILWKYATLIIFYHLWFFIIMPQWWCLIYQSFFSYLLTYSSEISRSWAPITAFLIHSIPRWCEAVTGWLVEA